MRYNARQKKIYLTQLTETIVPNVYKNVVSNRQKDLSQPTKNNDSTKCLNLGKKFVFNSTSGK